MAALRALMEGSLVSVYSSRSAASGGHWNASPCTWSEPLSLPSELAQSQSEMSPWISEMLSMAAHASRVAPVLYLNCIYFTGWHLMQIA